MSNNLSDVGYAGYGLETVEGTIVAPSVFLPASAFSFDSTHEYIIPSQLRGSRDKYVRMSGPYAVSGTMDMEELVSPGVGPLLISALAGRGNVTSGAYGGGGYQHVILPGDDSPTFSFESSAGDILVMRYGGIRVNTLSINAAFGEIVTSNWGFEGTTRAKQVSASSPSQTSVDPFHFTGASVKVDGSAVGNIKSFVFTAGNNIDRVGTLRKTLSWKRTALGPRDVGLTATMDFQDTSDYDLFLAESEFVVQLHMEGPYITGSSGPRHTLVIDIPRVSWNMVNAPLTAGSLIEQAVEASIVRPTNNDPICTVTLVTTDSVLLGAT